jgi:hypothetical protein
MDKLTAGGFVTTKLVEAKRHAAHTRNSATYGAALPEIARQVLVEYPGLPPEGKASIFGVFKHDAQSYKKHDLTMSLREVSRILGIATLQPTK